MKNKKHALRDFYILWCSQSLSQLGSALTGFALTLWLYEKTGSALETAALTICTYVPYVITSVVSGAITDKLNKKTTMLVCDALAAVGTIAVFVLYKANLLVAGHLYIINAITGLMNTVQEPTSEVAYTLVVPKEHYQRTSGLQSLTRSLISIGCPPIASMLYGMAGLDVVIAVDLVTFVIAFLSLALLIKLPATSSEGAHTESVRQLVGEGLRYLRSNTLVLDVILFMAGVNFVASAFDATLPALVLPNPRGGNSTLGMVTACSGVAMVIGSLLVTVMPRPQNRVKAIYISMFFSLGIENFLLAFSREPLVWCAGQLVGWVLVPVMWANQDVIMRTSIPAELQGRVYACRNTLQYFTIPLGMFWGGLMVDAVCEPFMAQFNASTMPALLFGTGKGSGASLMMFVLGVVGVFWCAGFGQKLKRHRYQDA